MKPVGIVRKLNDNGRVVIPMELRKKYGIDYEDAEVEIFADADGIHIRKYNPSCIICGSYEDIKIIDDKKICRRCIEKLTDNTSA